MVKPISIEELLARNQQLKNTHAGERCFILGNGPSLKDVDLSLLADEFVFTVNSFSFVDGYEKVKTNVHFWMDFVFFDAHPFLKWDIDKIMENYRRIAEQKPIYCFALLEGYDFIKKHEFDKILNFYYLYQNKNEIVTTSRVINISLNRPLTVFHNVVQYAIIAAINMGFKEIYLLGCDSTYVLTTLSTALNKLNLSLDVNLNSALDKNNPDLHAYKDDKDKLDKIASDLIEHNNVSFIFLDQWILFVGYEKLYYICKNLLDIKLINCSSLSLIDSIPRANLMDVLKGSTTLRGGGY